MRFRISILPLLVAITCSLANATEPIHHYFIEAEHTTLEGPAQTSGGTVWCYGGQATWDAITSAGKYRLFVRVRSGYSGDHFMGVKGKTSYQATVDGKQVAFRYVPKTLVYGSDENNWSWIMADVGSLKRGPHTLVFKSGWTFGQWDAFILTSNVKFVPQAKLKNRRETPLDLNLLTQEQRRWFQGYTLWKADVEKNCPPAAKPPSASSLSSIRLDLCRNQFGAAAINVSNWLKKPLLLRVSRTEQESRRKEAKAKKRLPASALILRRAIPLPAPRKNRLADALPKMDEAGLLIVPPNETRQIWLEVRTHGLTGGVYAGQLRIEPLVTEKRCQAQQIDIDLNVANVSLAKQHPLGVFLFDYDTRRPGMAEDLKEHFVNWRHNCQVPHPALANPDFRGMDRHVKRELSEGARHIYFEHWNFRVDSSWKKSKNRSKWVAGTRKWAKHVREKLQLPYDRFSLHIFDEVSGGGIDSFLQARAIVREADPKVRVTMTVTPHVRLSEVQRLDPGVDIWSPHMNLYQSKSKEIPLFLQKTKKPLLPYYCAENKRFWPAQHYRVWPWRAYQQKFAGLFLWNYVSRNAWDGRSWDGGMVFAGNGSMVPSRRWELMRLGLQDWLLLRQAAKAGHARLVQEIVDRVLAQPKNAQLIREGRKRLLRVLSAAEKR